MRDAVDELIDITVVVRLDGGLSMEDAIDPDVLEAILEQGEPDPELLEQIASELSDELGLTVDAIAPWSIAASGTRQEIEAAFDVSLEWVEDEDGFAPGEPSGGRWVPSREMTLPNARFVDEIESIHIAARAVGLHGGMPALPLAVPHLGLADIPDLLGVGPDSPTGRDVHVCVIDSGWLTTVTETKPVLANRTVTVDHEVRSLVSVIGLENGFTRSFEHRAQPDGRQIEFDPPLPDDVTTVDVTYGCEHPHFDSVNRGPGTTTALSARKDGALEDRLGHGTVVVAQLLATAPEVDLTVVCGWGLKGVQRLAHAIRSSDDSHPRFGGERMPDVINCSWQMAFSERSDRIEYGTVLVQLASWIKQGVTVVCSGGNAYPSTSREAWWYYSDHHPVYRPITLGEAVVVGGAFPRNGGVTASDATSSYRSAFNPNRHVPDLVGLCGMKPSAHLTALPVPPGSFSDDLQATRRVFDWQPRIDRMADGTRVDDGWVIWSGSSTAAADVSAVAALVLSAHPWLSPASLKQALEMGAKDVVRGASASGHMAARGWDPATGHGLVHLGQTLEALGKPFSPFMLASPAGETIPVPGSRPWSSPDMVVLREPWDRADQGFARDAGPFGLDDDFIVPGSDAFLYVRVHNAGGSAGSVEVEISLEFPDSGGETAVDVVSVDIDRAGIGVSRPIRLDAETLGGDGQHAVIVARFGESEVRREIGTRRPYGR